MWFRSIIYNEVTQYTFLTTNLKEFFSSFFLSLVQYVTQQRAVFYNLYDEHSDLFANIRPMILTS